MEKHQQELIKEEVKRKNKPSRAGLIWLAVIILMSLAGEAGEELFESRGLRQLVHRIQSWLFFHGIDPPLLDAVPLILLGLVLLLVVLVVMLVVKGSKAAAQGREKSAYAEAARASVRSEIAERAAASRTTTAKSGVVRPAAARPDPRSKSFVKPDAHCVSCELSGEDHFERDRAQRIAQLDEWLKNGLIDKNEYRTLKRRYMQE